MPKSSFDDEVNNILNEINFAGILGGAAKLGTSVLGSESKLASDIAGTTGAMGALKIDVNKGIDVATGLANRSIEATTNKIDDYIKSFANSGDFNKNLKIDDNVIKSLNGVWGEIKDNTRYKSYADLSNKSDSIARMLQYFNGKTLGEVKQIIINLLIK
jgi:hypothetical protein